MTTAQQPVTNTDLILRLRNLVGDKHVYTNAKARKVFSTDAYTFSPVLTEALQDKVADVVVAPGSVSELEQIVSLAVQHNVPVTIRGAGTGNYGQSVPLEAGIVVLMRRLNTILELDVTTKRAKVQPGVIIGALERRARELGLEVPCYPSTWNTATIGGFVSGGFGGVGSIRNGTLWDGMVVSCEVMSAEVTPQYSTLTDAEVLSVIHAYGVSGIMTELEISLVDAVAWEEAVLAFDDLTSALRFGYALSLDEAFDKRLICTCEPPIAGFFRPLNNEISLNATKTHVLLELAQGQTEAVSGLAQDYGGTCVWQRPSDKYHKSGFSLSDFSWNHTTLWAMKANPNYTYLQAMFASEFDTFLAQVDSLKQQFPEELLMHLEYVYIGDKLTPSGLPIVSYQGKTRLYEMIDAFEAAGVEIADPHTWRLDADPRWNGTPVVDGKASRNPLGLLNPGKL
ncbi:MAG: FAD-binding oxidoreductase [Deinococcota bacterium]